MKKKWNHGARKGIAAVMAAAVIAGGGGNADCPRGDGTGGNRQN